ncbi:MAG: asparagine synthase (glutamine-hydrolyzing), partial [Actinomycetota bacterium]|nr:asparagine synthase (glutamine-hydrolyzing) [Actinomycetota bacterium]
MKIIVSSMASAVRHRGPDDAGTWVDSRVGVAFGHRRLAIVDLSEEGHQPMVSKTGRYILAFNGEIYNFRSVRDELDTLGERFRGRSDTEVLLQAIERWGLEGSLPRMNGMFSLALWDVRQRTLYLARDRMGEKPLYYGWCGSAFLFGSELKSVRAYPGFNAEIDRGAAALFLRHNCIPSPHSIYSGICKLAPGTIATLAPEHRPGHGPALSSYWRLSDIVENGANDPLGGSPSDIADHLESALLDAVGLQMRADVPLGAFLSGGIDSSLIVALMQAQSGRPVKTFTAGFGEAAYDEAEPAAKVAAHLGTEHVELRITADDALAVIPHLPMLYDEPFADSSQIPTFLISKMTRDHVTVSLSGDGGDELFGGYNRYTWCPSL